MLITSITDPEFSVEHAKAIAAVAGDLNIARRNYTAYPAGHPLIESSLTKLMDSFRLICRNNSSLQLGITRDGFMVGSDYLERNNQICRQVAAAFFERGIGSLLVMRPPGRDELLAVLGILMLKREEVFASGGIEKLWQEAGITALEIRAIRYDRFSGTEEQQLDGEEALDKPSATVWERFVRLLMRGDVGLSSTDPDGSFRPEVLAALLNADFSRRSGEGSGLSANTLHSFSEAFQQMVADMTPAADNDIRVQGDGVGADTDGDASAQADLLAFINALDPVLRRQILNGFCETVAEDVATSFFSTTMRSLLQDTYATAEEYAAAPKVLQGILRKLLPHMIETYRIDEAENAAAKRMHALLQEHQLEMYMPEGYLQGLLDSLKPGTIKPLDNTELAPLLLTLSPQYIDSRGSEIILQLVIADPDSHTAKDLINDLAELCGHFLELGDYGQVLRVLNQAADPRLPQQLRIAMRDAFCRREFLDEILSGLKIWGKPKYDQVTMLIQVLGRAFIEPLLDRMAEEDNMSLRRFMMDRVQSFGTGARPHLLARLADTRWYVLRNIIITLRAIGGSEDMENLRPLLRHPHPKVRSEALKSLIMIGDPVAQRQVLRDLDSDDREVQLHAISLADRNSPPELSRKLLSILTSGGYTAVECELKSAAIHALGEIGRVEVLPELAKILGTRSLLAYKALNRLKLDIVRSFERYPLETAVPLLERLAKGNDDLASQAAESLKNLRSKLV